ncbi:DUF6929 family protein [Flavobacterium sp.]|uniref:DUF6929 family protein n=1 Tax=Flavobacterium sp. TaxID=239 RepID=UPI003C33887B
MEKFTLEILFHIIGIGSASGLFYQNNQLYIVSDNSEYLYEYSMKDTQLQKYPLTSNPTENIPKKEKPDFESVLHYQDSLYIFGSGSTQNRNKMVEFDLNQKRKTTTNNLVDLYAVMQSFASIKPAEFNLEGAVYEPENENWYFFNRGNGVSGKNTLFTFHGKKLNQEFSLLSNDYKLPKIKGVRTSFTDAVLVEDNLYFLAAAEDTNSTYEDGQVLGTVLGCINLETMKMKFTKKISDNHKFEGISLYKQSNNQIDFLLCEDNDTASLETNIYKLSINIK